MPGFSAGVEAYAAAIDAWIQGDHGFRCIIMSSAALALLRWNRNILIWIRHRDLVAMHAERRRHHGLFPRCRRQRRQNSDLASLGACRARDRHRYRGRRNRSASASSQQSSPDNCPTGRAGAAATERARSAESASAPGKPAQQPGPRTRWHCHDDLCNQALSDRSTKGENRSVR